MAHAHISLTGLKRDQWGWRCGCWCVVTRDTRQGQGNRNDASR